MRDDCARMSPPSTGKEPNKRPRAAGRSRSAAPKDEPGVLSSLPNTRPQRPSARRAAAQRATAVRAERAAETKPERTTKPRTEPAPAQGFETEEEIEPGRSVQPPSGAELAGSLAELVGELAQAGLSTGGRLLKDALTRLSGT
jgi:hypothetical protein